jgi:hypothetical protein
MSAWKRMWVMVLPAAFLPAASLASPRDDMLAGIARCNAFADERTFLDCVYGAAQPVRSELGLAPALPGQIRLVPREMTPSAALPPMGGLGGGAPVASMPVANMPVANAPITNAPPPERGFVDRLLGSGKPVTVPTAMRSYSFDRGGLFTVTLNNGEIWRQTEGDFTQAHWNKPATNYVVSVTTGAAGTFNLKVQDEAVIYKVKRQR